MVNNLIKVGSVIAIGISCLGLLGIISLITIQRTKEIGVRKVLGASILSIVMLLTKDFVKLILIAIMISLPVAWWVMHSWLQGFAYRIEIKWWMFATSAVLALVIVCLTASLQSIKAALMNPVKSMKND